MSRRRLRIVSIALGSWISPISRIVPPHFGQTSGSTTCSPNDAVSTKTGQLQAGQVERHWRKTREFWIWLFATWERLGKV